MMNISKGLILGRKHFLFRTLCTKKKEPALTAEILKGRSILLIKGRDANSLLQSISTNDLTKLDNKTTNKSIYTVFLNNKGKVLFDAIIYKFEDDYLLEVDSKAVQAVKIHLKMYKGGRQAEVKNLEDRLSVWSVLGHTENDLEQLEELVVGSEWISSMDPRLWELGLRMVGPRKGDLVDILKTSGIPVVQAQKGVNQCLRYSLGVAQGITEIFPGRCLPHETNADFLSGICPKKTNYIGWKPDLSLSYSRRMIPLLFSSNFEETIPINSPIQDPEGKKKTPIGLLCGLKRNIGLGLMSVADVLKNTEVRINNRKMSIFVKCNIPSWWPN